MSSPSHPIDVADGVRRVCQVLTAWFFVLIRCWLHRGWRGLVLTAEARP
jgi:hypothetical protein